MKNLKHYGFLAMNKHKSQQEWTSSTSAKSGGAVLAAELRREMRKITSQIMHYNIGRHRKGSVSKILKSHSVLE
jgi:predicted nucleotidyltransferase